MFCSRLKTRLLLSETAESKNKRLHWRADQQDMFLRVSRVRDTACRHLLANLHRDLCVKWKVAQSVEHLYARHPSVGLKTESLLTLLVFGCLGVT